MHVRCPIRGVVCYVLRLIVHIGAFCFGKVIATCHLDLCSSLYALDPCDLSSCSASPSHSSVCSRPTAPAVSVDEFASRPRTA
jgi:hypothetical protein